MDLFDCGWDQIRQVIYEAMGGKEDCRAYKVPDGRIFVYRGSYLEDKFDQDGDQSDEWEDWTPEEKNSAVQLSCLDCPNFYDCSDIDSLIEEYEEKYGEPTSVEIVKKKLQKRKKKNYKISSPNVAADLKLSPYRIECPFCQVVIEVSGDMDDIVVNCPACGEELYITKEDALKERCSRSQKKYNIRCPFCEQRIEVPAELDNTIAKCPSCGEELYLTREDAID